MEVGSGTFNRACTVPQAEPVRNEFSVCLTEYTDLFVVNARSLGYKLFFVV